MVGTRNLVDLFMIILYKINSIFLFDVTLVVISTTGQFRFGLLQIFVTSPCNRLLSQPLLLFEGNKQFLYIKNLLNYFII